MELTGGNQALDDTDMLSPQFCPAEQPCLPAHRNGAQGPFQVVGVHGKVRVFQEDPQLILALDYIAKRFSVGIGREQVRAL